MKLNKYFSIACAIILSFGMMSCDDDELSQTTVAFTGSKGASISESSTGSVSLTIRTARPVASNSAIVLDFSSTSAAYGTNYTTSPAMLSSNEVRVNFDAGATQATVQFFPIVDGVFTSGHEINVRVKETYGDILDAVDQTFVFQIEDVDVPPTLASFNFENCAVDFDAPAEFTVVAVDGFKTDRLWGCTAFGNNGTRGVQVNGFGGAAGASNAWMILDLNNTPNAQGGGNINPASLSDLYLQFSAQSFFGGPGTIRVKFSSDYTGSGDPEANGTWTEITETQALLPAGGSRVWQDVFVKLEGAAGLSQVYVALQYVDASTGSAASWSVDDYSILGL